MYNLPCFVCKKDLPNLMEGKGNQPNGGVEFTTHGHYGSREFDPMDGTFLAINVCDECLCAAKTAGAVLRGSLTISRRAEYEPYADEQ